ncbi:MAG: phage tail fiber protein, partial [Geminicoccaceae bacterium]
IQFNQATAAWGDITHVAIVDSSTVGGGNILFTAQLSGGAVTIDANDRLAFQIGDLQFQLT